MYTPQRVEASPPDRKLGNLFPDLRFIGLTLAVAILSMISVRIVICLKRRSIDLELNPWGIYARAKTRLRY